MDVAALLLELYGRIPPLARHAVAGLDSEQLARQPGPGANTIAWLIWHLARVQDDHVAGVLGTDQMWVTGGWAARVGVDPDPHDIGFGHDEDEMLAIRPDGPEVLTGYLDAVQARTTQFIVGLEADDLDRIVDEHWDPPVTLGVRLISVADDSLQHAGQAAYARGLLGY